MQQPQDVFVFEATTTSLAIREYLARRGEGYAHEFYRMFKKVRPGISYNTVTHYFYILRQLGLIERTSRRDGKSQNLKIVLHKVAPGHQDDDAWRNPQKAYTALRQ